MNPHDYRNIIFDLGGVILNIDYKLPEKAFERLGMKDFSKIYSKAAQEKLFDLFETGKMSPAEFRNSLRKYLPPAVSDAEIDRAWNSMLLDMPEERVRLITGLRKTHKVFLLSNTNEIHFTAVAAYIQEKFGRDILARMFDAVYLSHERNMRKPDRGIFELALRENGLRPEETLFIDDSIQHIEGARKTGITAYHLQKEENITDLFR
ncbi:MAG: HAD family phosphatase [Bacteroidota bacterium]